MSHSVTRILHYSLTHQSKRRANTSVTKRETPIPAVIGRDWLPEDTQTVCLDWENEPLNTK